MATSAIARLLLRSGLLQLAARPVWQGALIAASERLTAPTAPRCIGTSRIVSDLYATLQEEIQYEKDAYHKSEVVAAGPPAPFTLSDTPGDGLVQLVRKYEGQEVRVECSINHQDQFQVEGEFEDSKDTVVNFNVTVEKDGKCLVFECSSDGTAVEIKHVTYEPSSGLDSDTAYSGPVFEELDDNLKTGFHDFLKVRGVTAELGEYLRHLLYDKEENEYIGWLQNVQKFVK